MASMFNPDSNSAKGPPAAASVGGGKTMDMLGGMANQFGAQQQAQPQMGSFSSRIDPNGGYGAYQPPTPPPDMGQQMNGFMSFGGSKPTVSTPQSNISTNPKGK